MHERPSTAVRVLRGRSRVGGADFKELEGARLVQCRLAGVEWCSPAVDAHAFR